MDRTRALSRLRLVLRQRGFQYPAGWIRRDEQHPSFAEPGTQACTYEQFTEPSFEAWTERIAHELTPHRKLWEYCYILQALDRSGVIGPDRRGLGFGVGLEPIPSYLASRGCSITATDLGVTAAESAHWLGANQHATSFRDLNHWSLCDGETFAKEVQLRDVDMRAIPADLRGYDFTWSSCALEHLGSLEAGLDFLERQMECLRPGGVAVHTTELNVSSNRGTVASGRDVLYRRRDLEECFRRLASAGHSVARATFYTGEDPNDRHVDLPPYQQSVHLKLLYRGYVTTSFGVVIRKSPDNTSECGV